MTRFLLGYAIALVGGLLLLSAGVWWSWASDGYRMPGGPPRPWRALVAVGWVLFVLGLVVQATGYVGVHRLPQPPIGAYIAHL